MSKILVVVAPNGYQDFEYGNTKTSLETNGHKVITASTVEKPKGSLGGSTIADLLLENVNPEDYDAIAFIGGPGTSVYFQNPKALELAQSFFKAGKITSAICIAPVILGNAGILEGKKSTVFPSGVDDINQKGAIFTDTSVQIDGNIVTANGPAAAKDFGEKIAKLLWSTSVNGF